jgi:hypothetical protein
MYGCAQLPPHCCHDSSPGLIDRTHFVTGTFAACMLIPLAVAHDAAMECAMSNALSKRCDFWAEAMIADCIVQ